MLIGDQILAETSEMNRRNDKSVRRVQGQHVNTSSMVVRFLRTIAHKWGLLICHAPK
eukprot:COSAG01_NODE_1576_length_9855_cov_32.477962_7_plen_57_part_00